MPPTLSVISMSYRPGGIDLLAMALAEQTYKDYELILVDDLPGRPERGMVAQGMARLGVPMAFHGPGKPRDCRYPYGMANAMNTGLQRAKGQYVIFVHDYTFFPPNALERWYTEFQSTKRVTSGWGQVYSAPKPDHADDWTTWVEHPVKLDTRFQWIPEVMENFYFGAPMEFFHQINGIDERAGLHFPWALTSMMAQAQLLGWPMHVEPDLPCSVIDHRQWEEDKEPGKQNTWRILMPKHQHKPPIWQAHSPNDWGLEEIHNGVEDVKSYAQVSGNCFDQDIPFIRELMAYDARCEHSCTFKREPNGQLAQIYAPSPMHWSRQAEWPWVLREGRFKSHHRVLDIGGGWSILKYALADRCREVVVVDNDPEALRKSEDTLAKFGTPNIIHELADARKLPYPDNSFDRVVSISVLEHIENGHLMALREAMRVLKPGGLLLLTMDVVIEDKQTAGNFYVNIKTAGETLAVLGIPHTYSPEDGNVIGAYMKPEDVNLVVMMILWQKPKV